MLTSKGASGVTGAGFITLAATLTVVPTVPVAGLALILGIDRFMSEARALTNFIGNGVAAIVVSRWENDLDQNALRKELAGLHWFTPRPYSSGRNGSPLNRLCTKISPPKLGGVAAPLNFHQIRRRRGGSEGKPCGSRLRNHPGHCS